MRTPEAIQIQRANISSTRVPTYVDIETRIIAIFDGRWRGDGLYQMPTARMQYRFGTHFYDRFKFILASLYGVPPSIPSYLQKKRKQSVLPFICVSG